MGRGAAALPACCPPASLPHTCRDEWSAATKKGLRAVRRTRAATRATSCALSACLSASTRDTAAEHDSCTSLHARMGAQGVAGRQAGRAPPRLFRRTHCQASGAPKRAAHPHAAAHLMSSSVRRPTPSALCTPHTSSLVLTMKVALPACAACSLSPGSTTHTVSAPALDGSNPPEPCGSWRDGALRFNAAPTERLLVLVRALATVGRAHLTPEERPGDADGRVVDGERQRLADLARVHHNVGARVAAAHRHLGLAVHHDGRQRRQHARVHQVAAVVQHVDVAPQGPHLQRPVQGGHRRRA